GVPRAAPDLFGVACELRHVDPRAAITSFTGVAGRLGGLTDAARSAVLAGVDHELLAAPETDPGAPPAVLIYAMRRLPRLSDEDYFIDHTRSMTMRYEEVVTT